MLKTKQRSRRQIKDLKTDLEIINPIESKTLLGGNWYEQLDNVTVNRHGWASGAGDFGGTYDPFYDGSSTNDWYNYGENYGGGDGSNASPEELLENPNATELSWLFNNVSVQELAKMIDNRNFAFAKAASLPGLNNGLGDAFRHALWSAADAADIGIVRTIEFHTLHETSNPDRSNAMDLFNNSWGYNWFLQCGDPVSNMNQFTTDFNNAVANGQIQTQP